MEKILLGAGTIFMAEATDNAVPEDLFDEKNETGVTYGGATLEVKPEIKEIANDFDEVKISSITRYQIALKCGLAEIDGDKVKKVLGVGTFTEADGGASSTYVISDKDTSLKTYAIGFKHRDGEVKVTIVATNTEGLSFAFDKENETKMEPTFTAKKNAMGEWLKIEGL